MNMSESNRVISMQFIWQPIHPTHEVAEAGEVSRPQDGKGWGGSFELLAGYLSRL